METKERLIKAVAELDALRVQISQIERKELSDAVFARRFLSFSPASWSKLHAPDKYGAKLDSMAVKCEEDIERTKGRIEALQKRAASDADDAWAPKVGRSYVFVREGHQWSGCEVTVLSARKRGFEVSRCCRLCDWILDPAMRTRKPASWVATADDLC